MFTLIMMVDFCLLLETLLLFVNYSLSQVWALDRATRVVLNLIITHTELFSDALVFWKYEGTVDISSSLASLMRQSIHTPGLTLCDWNWNCNCKCEVTSSRWHEGLNHIRYKMRASGIHRSKLRSMERILLLLHFPTLPLRLDAITYQRYASFLSDEEPKYSMKSTVWHFWMRMHHKLLSSRSKGV